MFDEQAKPSGRAGSWRSILDDVRVRFGLIFIAAVVIRVVFWAGMALYDDAHYAKRAYELSTGAFTPPRSIFAARIGLVGPAAIIYRLLGVGIVTTGLFPFLCSLASVGVAFGVGRRLYDDRAGLLAAFLIAIFPMDVIFSSELYATAQATLLCGLALGCFLLGERASAERGRRTTWYVLSGACLGLAALAHEEALVILIFYPAYAALVRRPVRHHLFFLVGLLPILALDPLVNAALGDAAARLRILGGPALEPGAAADATYRGLEARWLFEPLARFLTEQELGLFPLPVMAIAAWRVWRPVEKADRTLATFLLVVGFWTLYGTVSPTRFAPLARLPRYLSPLALPAAWLLGRELSRWRPRWKWAALVVLAATSIACVFVDNGRFRMRPYLAASRLLHAAVPARVLVPRSDRAGLDMAEGFSPPYILQKMESADLHDAVVATFDDTAHARVAALPGATVFATEALPDTPYMRVLRWRPVSALLHLTRPTDRSRDLEKKAATATVRLTRLP